MNSSWDKVIGFLGAIHRKARDSGMEDEAKASIMSLAEKALQEVEVSVEKAFEQHQQNEGGNVVDLEGKANLSNAAKG